MQEKELKTIGDMKLNIKNVVEFTKLKEDDTFEKDGLIYKVVEPVMNRYLENGIYTLEIIIPENGFIKQHSHQYSHTSILAKGKVEIIADGKKQIAEAPAVLTLDENVMHEIRNLGTEAIWYCVHQTTETDIDKVEDSLTNTNE